MNRIEKKDITWGEYLCKGIEAKTSEQEPNRSESPAEKEVEKSPVMKKVEKALRYLGLTPFSTSVILQYITARLQEGKSEKLQHVVGYLLQMIQPNLRVISEERKGCPQVIPNLRSFPFWDRQEFSWIEKFESFLPDIQREFYELREKSIQSHMQVEEEQNKSLKCGFQRYSSPKSDFVSESNEPKDVHEKINPNILYDNATDKGSWNVCYFHLNGITFEENVKNCPKTMEAIKSIPRQYHHSLFSSLAANTHVKAHYGPTNKKLRVYFPVIVPDKDAQNNGRSTTCWIRANGIKRYVKEGECLVFDDSFYHDAANESVNQPRLVLLVDIWHPDLSDEEIKVLEFVNKGQILATKRLAQQQQAEACSSEQPAVNFLTAIQSANQQGIDAAEIERIWGKEL